MFLKVLRTLHAIYEKRHKLMFIKVLRTPHSIYEKRNELSQGMDKRTADPQGKQGQKLSIKT